PALDIVEERVEIAHAGRGYIGADETAAGVRIGHAVRDGARTLTVVLDREDRPIAVGVPGPGGRPRDPAQYGDVADHVEAAAVDVERVAGGPVLHLRVPAHGAVAVLPGLERERAQVGDAGIARVLEVPRSGRQVRDRRVCSGRPQRQYQRSSNERDEQQ